MKLKVLYDSKKGTTKQFADVISAAVKAKGEQIPPINPLNDDKLVFLGFGMKGKFPYVEMIDFCNGLDNSKMVNAAMFINSDKGDADGAYIADILRRKEINLVGTFKCTRAHGLFGKGKPTEEDFNRAAEWAKEMEKKVFGNE